MRSITPNRLFIVHRPSVCLVLFGGRQNTQRTLSQSPYTRWKNGTFTQNVVILSFLANVPRATHWFDDAFCMDSSFVFVGACISILFSSLLVVLLCTKWMKVQRFNDCSWRVKRWILLCCLMKLVAWFVGISTDCLILLWLFNNSCTRI